MKVSYYLYRIFRILFSPFFWLIYFLSGFVPRSSNVVIFGSTGGMFSDNSKYLFLQPCNSNFSVKKVWITSSLSTVREIRGIYKKKAYLSFSPMGIYYLLIGNKYFFNCYISDIGFWLSNGAIKINLWHGYPLKKIEYDIDVGPLKKIYNPNNYFDKINQILRRLINPSFMLKPDFIYNKYKSFDNIFFSAFRLDSNSIIRNDYPRVEFLKSKIGGKRGHDFLNIIYLPTMRESYFGDWVNNVALKNVFDLNEILINKNIFLDIKLHPNDINSKLSFFTNIKILDNNQDIYNYLFKYDYIITDYSSVIFDAYEINIPIILYWPDHSEYVKNSRGFYLNIETFFDDKILYDWKDFLYFFNNDLGFYAVNSFIKNKLLDD